MKIIQTLKTYKELYLIKDLKSIALGIFAIPILILVLIDNIIDTLPIWLLILLFILIVG